jgi:hypothetical protein
MFVQHKKE